MPARSGDDYAHRINALPKHVASRTLEDAVWNASVIEGDVAEEVAKLKAEPGQSILKFGTGELDRTLLQRVCSTSSTCGSSPCSGSAVSV
jgi:hypothetical protein